MQKWTKWTSECFMKYLIWTLVSFMKYFPIDYSFLDWPHNDMILVFVDYHIFFWSIALPHWIFFCQGEIHRLGKPSQTVSTIEKAKQIGQYNQHKQSYKNIEQYKPHWMSGWMIRVWLWIGLHGMGVASQPKETRP